jgi:hypothetical protein
MSMDTEVRECNTCGCRVVLQDISDAHGGGGMEFLASPEKGEGVGWRAVEKCPGCGTDLSRETTTKAEG